LIKESLLYHHRFTLYDPRAMVEFTDLLEIRTLELPKLPETPDVYLWHWLRFFRAETMEELKMVATASPAIQKATAKVLKLSKDERARLLHEYEVKARRDEMARLDYIEEKGMEAGLKKGMEKGLEKGMEAGLKKGLEKGKAEERVAIVRNMLKLNLPMETIIKATSLSPAEIQKLSQ
jgi:predicted transposase/invertase (TIGR01784 family)